VIWWAIALGVVAFAAVRVSARMFSPVAGTRVEDRYATWSSYASEFVYVHVDPEDDTNDTEMISLSGPFFDLRIRWAANVIVRRRARRARLAARSKRVTRHD
jgi:hypothetical protein